MKMNFFLILAFCMQVSAKGISQQISLTLKAASLEKALTVIKQQSNYHFFYDAQLLKEAAPVTVQLKNVSLQEALQQCMAGQPFSWHVDEENKLVVIGKKPPASFTNEPGATVSVSGTVLDDQQHPVPGATVVLRPFNKGTITSEKGEFIIRGVSPGDYILVVSSVGYVALERSIKVGSDAVQLKIFLKPDVKMLDSVVIGYGVTTQRTKTEAIASISSKQLLEDHSSISVSDMLSGKLPGLYALKSGGAPGAGSTLYIRGLSTFNNSDPLVVIDGIPDRSLDDLNANDVETISILKDAAAISVYGARAANGVILVTTKKGRSNKTSITFTANAINQRPTQYYKQVNSYQYAQLFNESLQNEGLYQPGQGIGFTDEQVQLYKNGTDPNRYPNTNWIKDVLAPSIWQKSYNLAAAGGSETTHFYLSGGYTKNEGLIPVENYSRYNLRSNVDAQIAKGLKVSMNLSGSFSKDNSEAVYGSEYIINNLYETPPTRVLQFTNGLYASVPEQRGNSYLQSRGNSGYWRTNNNIFNSLVTLQYDLPWIKGLSIKGNGAYDKSYSFSKRFATPFDMYTLDDDDQYTQVPAYPTAPFLTEYFTQDQRLTLEGGMQYDGAFKQHNVTGMLLYTQTNGSSDNFSTRREGFVSSSLSQLNLGDPTRATNNGSGSQSARRGIVGRFQYNYDERYLFQFNFRYDGSDIFPPGHRYGFFPSFSAGWVISEEPFMKHASGVLDFLKLRASWGQLGNDRVNPYQFLTTYALGTSSGYSLGGPTPTFYQTLTPNILPNPSFTWERAVIANVGIEAHVKQDLLTVEADYFIKRTKDILTPPTAQVPSVLGISLSDENNGVVQTSGFEITLGHTNHLGRFTYSIAPNISFSRNRIVNYPESKSIPEWQKVSGKNIRFWNNTVGNAPTLYRSSGLYQTQDDVTKGPTPLYPSVAAGDIRYKDLDGDGVLTHNDATVSNANFFPQIQYGIRLSASYSGLDLNIQLQGTGNVVGYGYVDLPASTQLLDRWTPTHTNATYPRLWYNNQNNTVYSDYWVRNTAYMRLKNMELAYNLPSAILQHIHAKGLRFAVSTNNLLTFTHFKLFDPEGAGQVRDPLMKSFTAGASLQF
ncbi:TonB-linked outer membrane protein, SusC/RagA family [Chitinophaga costaii]|uniref:TonB-linked outer membrane protein, SusC/RagA family n=1 Tax=Chitinophaga costaii TaxID=1335309 RepID=A0A1C4FC24_9BACT|nr:TonB-dependent receptor [Chitinophaga costaii]SCC53432.1 TonB-linked outer membrane protein, SusC/RagA family [Chitinophaga costaii]